MVHTTTAGAKPALARSRLRAFKRVDFPQEQAMPKTTFLGHPLHPQLIAAPAALLPFTLVLDLLFRRTGKRSYREAAYYSLVGGVAGGAAAGVSGAMDYLTIPSESHEKQVANVHAGLNVALLTASVVNLVLRSRGDDARHPLPFALSALAAAGVLVSSWYGGHLVYEHGLRVKGKSPIGQAPEIKPPLDEKMKQGVAALEPMAPAAGPQERHGGGSRP
jgi:uncharacterized membrane protein